MSQPISLVTPKQYEFDLTIEKEVEINGVGMGVLSDGTPYLTGRGLARMCGVAQSAVQELTSGWSTRPVRPREAKIKELLSQQGVETSLPYIPITKDGIVQYAYPDAVCMAVLEYYAFEAGQNVRDQALKNYRLLGRASLREFIYIQVGYDPRGGIPVVWKQFHDRVSLVYDTVPHGYFIVFKEIADVIVTLIRSGAEVGPHFVPDISVGQRWAEHWRSEECAGRFGGRGRFLHNYPLSFPQSASNPQDVYCYPDAALPEFRRWMREEYLPSHFSTYLQNKQRQNALPPTFAEVALLAIEDRLDHSPEVEDAES